jgi:sulfite exporter TauE/SafE
MSQSSMGSVQNVLTGATLGGGGLSWLTQYTSEITVAAVVITGVFSILFGFWNARSNAKRNDINELIIKGKIIKQIEKAGIVDSEELKSIKLELEVD